MYKEVTIINTDVHFNLKFQQLNTFDFAKNIAFVPIVAAEYYLVQKSQPIVFSKQQDQTLNSVALLSFTEGNNLFVTKTEWRVGEYCPFVIRRFPFIFAQTGNQLSLAYDTKSKALSTTKGEPLFTKDKKLSSLGESILDTMNRYQADTVQTQLFLKKIEELELFVDLDTQVIVNNQTYNFEGFLKISEDKLNKLSDNVKLELVNNGMYNLILAHLLSLASFQKLADYTVAATNEKNKE